MVSNGKEKSGKEKSRKEKHYMFVSMALSLNEVIIKWLYQFL